MDTNAFTKLSERDQGIVSDKFTLKLTYVQIAVRRKVSKQRVHQIVAAYEIDRELHLKNHWSIVLSKRAANIIAYSYMSRVKDLNHEKYNGEEIKELLRKDIELKGYCCIQRLHNCGARTCGEIIRWLE